MSKNVLIRSMASVLSFAMLVSAVVPNPTVYAKELQILEYYVIQNTTGTYWIYRNI